MIKFLKSTLFSIAIILFVACENQPKENKQNRDQVFQDYKDFVTQTEDKVNTEYTETVRRAMQKSKQDSTAWQTESTEQMQEYESKKKKVQDNLSSYDSKQQEEFRQLENSYNRTLEKQKAKQQEVSRRYKLRNELLGIPVNADDMSNITAEELAGTYQRFIQKLSNDSVEIKSTDWDLIEGWWVALNNRKNALDAKLSADAKQSINQATKEYLLIKERQTAPR